MSITGNFHPIEPERVYFPLRGKLASISAKWIGKCAGHVQADEPGDRDELYNVDRSLTGERALEWNVRNRSSG